MHQMVADYCNSCETCQAIKPSNQKKIGLLYPLEPPMEPWESMERTALANSLAQLLRDKAKLQDPKPSWLTDQPTSP